MCFFLDIPLDVLQRPFGVTPDKEYVTNISEEMVTSELSIDTGSTCLAASPLISPMSTQTPSTLTSNTPRKSKLKCKVHLLRKKLIFAKKQSITENREKSSLLNFNKLCNKFLNKPLAEIVKLQALLKNKVAKARSIMKNIRNLPLHCTFYVQKHINF